MYLCFEEEDRRLAFPEESLIAIDDNGFTLKTTSQVKGVSERMFIKLASHQGCVQNFTQALTWIKKKPKQVQADEFTNSAGVDMSEPVKPAAARKPVQAPKLPETPSF